jgi:hypothetical protein
MNNSENDDIEKTELDSPCQVCQIHPFKYKCPKCGKKTCCLICVKEHKKNDSCSGQKDKFNLSSNLTDFGDKELFQDIKFLNEGVQATNNSSKKLFNMLDDEEKKEKEKKNKYKKKNLKKIRNINLHCSPMIMTRFSQNETFVNFKDKIVFWTVKFNFLTENEKYEHIFKETFDDSQFTLTDIINYMFSHKEDLDLKLLMFLNKYTNEDFLKFQFLYRLNLKEMDKNFVKGKLVKIKKIHYEECNKKMLLKDLLEGKDVYDFPEFNIIINSQ